ncbi:MAG TPA: hypothetical protein VGO46_14445 [Gemmatimonadaceae bacterium]|nr:hypothetical protein [Gemmatimonadaceae bacterium]
MNKFMGLSTIVLFAACAKGKGDATTDTATAMAAPPAAAPAAAAPADTGMAGMHMDADKAASGTGVPAGYTGVTDHGDAKITDAKYTAKGGRWEIQTGPAHITFAAKDSAKGQFQISTTIDQLEKPKHPEAYGIFLGGSNLTDPAKVKYGYYVVRDDGKFLIKTRDGENTTTIVDWTESPKIPKADASGKATYKISVHVAPDTVHFIMDGNLVTAVPKSKFPTDGIAGIRVNHNLHVLVTPLTVSKY